MNNPQAFPHGVLAPSNSGMTLRDYFAGQALAGKCGYASQDAITTNHLVTEAFKIADAMLAEREKETK